MYRQVTMKVTASVSRSTPGLTFFAPFSSDSHDERTSVSTLIAFLCVFEYMYVNINSHEAANYSYYTCPSVSFNVYAYLGSYIDKNNTSDKKHRQLTTHTCKNAVSIIDKCRPTVTLYALRNAYGSPLLTFTMDYRHCRPLSESMWITFDKK